jgi:DNA polymerase-1
MIPKLPSLIETEQALTKVCFDMERLGIRINRDYCQAGYEHELGRANQAAQAFADLSGFPFVDSGKSLAKAFDAVGEAYPKTAKGNPSFKQDVLEGFTSPLAKLVLENRAASKKANTYYANFLYYADSEDRIHPNMRQAGTDTGRFSYSEPNLQNVPKEESGEMKVRSAFIPTSRDWCLVMIDYDQMEYRLMLDYAEQMDVIQQILDQGLDVHEATAKMMGVTRTAAKTLNFMLLYGGGTEKLAVALGVSLERAGQLKHKYFKTLGNIKAFTRQVMNRAESRGFIFNWAGRVCHFPLMRNPRTGGMDRFAYRAPNHLIQGGCADVVRLAMVKCHEFLKPLRSRMLLQVHDELLFEIHRSELGIVPELKRIMETAYPHRHLPLTCGVDHSWSNWGNKVSGIPN